MKSSEKITCTIHRCLVAITNPVPAIKNMQRHLHRYLFQSAVAQQSTPRATQE